MCNNYGRMTGKTYRLALDVCKSASTGLDVLVVAGNKLELEGLQRVCEQVAGGRLEVLGRISFKLASANFCGMSCKYDIVYEDEILGMTWRQIKQYKQSIANWGIKYGETK